MMKNGVILDDSTKRVCVQNKEDGTKDRALWDATGQQSWRGLVHVDDNTLSATSQI